MRTINIYPILSSLHDDEYIKKERENLLRDLKELTGYEFKITSIDNLYGGDLGIILVESGGSENYFLEVYDKLKGPYVFLTFKHNNSLAAAMEILTFLGREGKKGEILHGETEVIAERIKDLITEQDNSVKLGVIGAPSDWLISCNVNKDTLKRNFGIELIDVSTDELISNYHSHKYDKCPEDLLKATYDRHELNKAYRIYLSIKDIVKKYNLRGFTIRCFDLLDTIHSTACLALAMFNDEGIIGTCEGDLPALISMYLVKKLLNKPSFQANPSEIDTVNREMILAHCTLPLKMTNSYTFTTHYESKIGVGIKGEMNLGKCFIFRISADLDKYVILNAEIVENLSRCNLCRTQIRVKVKKGINYFLTNPLGNHHIIVYGDDYDKIINYLDSKNLKRIN